VQLSGDFVQSATTQTCASNVSQWLAWNPWQSVSDVQGVPKPVGAGLHAGRVSPLAQGTHAPPESGASGVQMHESEDGSKTWFGLQRSFAS
jgi:hypothetical protein